MMKRVGLASVSLLGSLSLASSLHAQTPAPAPAPAAPAPAAPAPAAPAPAPAPVAPAPDGATPAAAPAAATPGAAASVSASASTDGFGLAGGSADNAPPPTTEDDGAADREWRATSLHLGSALSGSTGLLHVTEAGAGAPGTFRFDVTGSYFTGSGFLCNGNSACPVFGAESPTSADDVTRASVHLGLSVTPWPFLEVYGGFHNHATSDSRGRPQLLQVLGDSNLGVKGFLPHSPNGIFSFGGEAELLLLNGTGGVGLDSGSTSFALRALATLDLNNRTQVSERIPLRFHANFGYLFDNAGKIVKPVEETPAPRGRGAPISRVERFGLDIDRVDFVQGGLAAEYVNEYVRPFLEWSLDIPVNRQNYTCVVREAKANGDLCLGLNQGMSTTPSRFTVGARAFPWPEHGLSVLAAFDIGTGATTHFIQEVAPELPWNFYFALGYAFDTVAPKPIIERVAAPPAPAAATAENVIEGTVVEKNTTNAVPDAIIKYDGRPLTGMVSGAEGTFRTANLEPGTYTFHVTAAGYHDGQCVATVQPPAAAPTVQSSAATPPPPGAVVAPGEPGSVALQVPPDPNAAHGGPNVVKVQCELEALPKVGSVIGSVTDPETNLPVDGAHIEVTDRLNRKLELRADASGAFRFENVPPGPLKFSVDAPGYFTAVAEVNVRAREEANARMLLNKRPTQPNVVVAGKEIKLKKQVHFQHDSAEILPDSQAILEELADLMTKRADIKNVEVQGHTDDTGAAAYNLRLSQSRAQAVVDAITALGVDSSRMTAKGYGQEKPLVPNSTETNRAKNRRVQVIITEQGK
ncbi:MAG: carboxypeptidase regulatory-like domain-containing protein [Pseudomonadota bacterium]